MQLSLVTGPLILIESGPASHLYQSSLSLDAAAAAPAIKTGHAEVNYTQRHSLTLLLLVARSASVIYIFAPGPARYLISAEALIGHADNCISPPLHVRISLSRIGVRDECAIVSLEHIEAHTITGCISKDASPRSAKGDCFECTLQMHFAQARYQFLLLNATTNTARI
jgi:hypothetical protein